MSHIKTGAGPAIESRVCRACERSPRFVSTKLCSRCDGRDATEAETKQLADHIFHNLCVATVRSRRSYMSGPTIEDIRSGRTNPMSELRRFEVQVLLAEINKQAKRIGELEEA